MTWDMSAPILKPVFTICAWVPLVARSLQAVKVRDLGMFFVWAWCERLKYHIFSFHVDSLCGVGWIFVKGRSGYFDYLQFPMIFCQSSQVIDFDTLESWSPAGSSAKAAPTTEFSDIGFSPSRCLFVGYKYQKKTFLDTLSFRNFCTSARLSKSSIKPIKWSEQQKFARTWLAPINTFHRWDCSNMFSSLSVKTSFH